jgi:hypothetical protein
MATGRVCQRLFQQPVKLQRLANMVEDSLVAQAAELDARLSTDAEQFPEANRQEFFEFHAEDYYELADELPTLLRYSILTGADTGLEVFLNDTCATYAEVHNATITLSDLRGAGVERARDYLKKVARMPFPDTTPEWTSVKRLHQLRNSIVHADGYIASDRNDIRKWAPSIYGLHIAASGAISLTREFTDAAISAYHAFAAQVDEACKQLALWHSVFLPVEDA